MTAIDEIGQAAPSRNIHFGKTALSGEGRYSRFFKTNAIPVEDIQDSQQIASAMRSLIRRFTPDFDQVAEVLAKQQWRSEPHSPTAAFETPEDASE